ncbi:SDR family NAD(P)-dependent oxidoreductase [Rhizobium gallicum]|uniref:SDR family NAD(P)-dependent oxidoreductase n=1 Tax=Rhizobium gallicum TaxID=56730 RepID=UPI001EF76901|nr:SDR family oxidoreductase [Rhizobium gallicum]ULJ74628.1 SDR family oxidoreductase [Rhizobium gallicum]
MQETLGIAVITGASGGIGALYADRLARQGYDLMLVARNGDRLQRVAAAIREQTGRAVLTVTADLTTTDDVARVATLITGDPRITMLVNNAGVGATAPLVQSDVNAMSAMIALNIDALMRLTYAAVPGFVERDRGTIINIASIVAVAPERLNGVYGGTKAFVLAFSQSLRQELAESKVHVQVVLPGATATDFWDVAGLPVQHLPQEMVMPAQALVDAALLGLSRKEFVTIPSLHDAGQWDAFEDARQAMAGNLSTNKPAARYRAA